MCIGHFKKQTIAVYVFLIVFGSGGFQNATAGALDSFEKDATKSRPSESKNKNNHTHNGDDDDFNPFAIFSFLGDIFNSSDDTNADPSASSIKNETGKTIIPYFRFDYHYQNVESDIDASDYRLLVGYGPFAFIGRKTFLQEDDPRDKLRIDQLYGLFRISFANYIELGMGIGQYKLVGNARNSDMAYTVPLTIRFTENFSIEFIPAWAKINTVEIEDYDLGVLIGGRFVSLKTGYRWIESPSDHLRGPYIGLSVYF